MKRKLRPADLAAYDQGYAKRTDELSGLAIAARQTLENHPHEKHLVVPAIAAHLLKRHSREACVELLAVALVRFAEIGGGALPSSASTAKMAGLTPRDRATLAHLAFTASIALATDRPLPPFDELSQAEQDAWIIAVDYVWVLAAGANLEPQ